MNLLPHGRLFYANSQIQQEDRKESKFLHRILSILTYVVCLVYAFYLFDDTNILAMLFCILSLALMTSLAGHILEFPLAMIPDVVMKAALATTLFFYVLRNGNIGTALLTLFALFFHYIEIYWVAKAVSNFYNPPSSQEQAFYVINCSELPSKVPETLEITRHSLIEPDFIHSSEPSRMPTSHQAARANAQRYLSGHNEAYGADGEWLKF